MSGKVKMGMIGGGKNAFIGAVHRIAANLDGQIELCAGCFSGDPNRSAEAGDMLFLPPDRVYSTYDEMLRKEAARPSQERPDFIAIVTPNHLHFAPAMRALELGFHVLVDKPVTFSLKEALLLRDRMRATGLLLCLTQTYSGYPLVKQARYMVAQGEFGAIRKIYVEYPQGWLSRDIESDGQKQASWRTDPSKSGKSGCMGDIGTHAAHLAEYISGLAISHVCADLDTVVQGRKLDDDGAILLRFNNGASGVLIASQVAAGEENPLSIRMYGEKGGLEWRQEEPNSLYLKWLDRPKQILRTGGPGLSEVAAMHTRTPAGHPEGYLEAFANIYRNFAHAVVASRRRDHEILNSSTLIDYPGIDEGIRGMAFIDTVVASSQSDTKWTAFETYDEPY